MPDRTLRWPRFKHLGWLPRSKRGKRGNRHAGRGAVGLVARYDLQPLTCSPWLHTRNRSGSDEACVLTQEGTWPAPLRSTVGNWLRGKALRICARGTRRRGTRLRGGLQSSHYRPRGEVRSGFLSSARGTFLAGMDTRSTQSDVVESAGVGLATRRRVKDGLSMRKASRMGCP